MNASPVRQEELEGEIRALIDEVRQQLEVRQDQPNHFVWLAEFAEVFNEKGGFDIVIANPPYVRHELITASKPVLRRVFGEHFVGTADLYCYFYLRAMQLLRSGGMLVFISSNKWFKAAYGEKLRKFMAEQSTILSITDFGELPVFKTAATFPMIFVARKEPREKQEAIFTQVRSLAPPYPDISALIAEHGYPLPERALSGSEWTLTDEETMRKLERMKLAGIPLLEYVGGKIYYGIKTGFNKAFILDGQSRDQIIAENPNSEEIITPLAIGDDIRRWHIRKRDRWLIVTKIGVDMRRYPEVLRHLSQWKEQLIARQDQGEKWWELRACAYYGSFDMPKIVYSDISMEPRFTLDLDNSYVLNTAYLIGVEDRFLLGLLNSSHFWFFMSITAALVGDPGERGRIRMIRQYVEHFPIPHVSAVDRKNISDLVQHCLDAKAEDSDADVTDFEAEIEKRVEFLYFHRRPEDGIDTYDEWLAQQEAEKGSAIEEVRKLLAIGHETTEYECKSSFSWGIEQSEYVDRLKDEVHIAICAMLNAKGGDLLVGVEDDMNVLGLARDLERYDNKDKLIQAIEGPLGKTLLPNPIGLVDIKPVDIDAKTILRIQVKPDNSERYTFKENIYVRRNSKSKPALTAAEAATWWPKRRAGDV